MGRYAEADAAVIVVQAASDRIAGAIDRASETVHERTRQLRRRIIYDMTTEWYYPQKSAHGWRQVAKIYELRGLNMQKCRQPTNPRAPPTMTIVDQIQGLRSRNKWRERFLRSRPKAWLIWFTSRMSSPVGVLGGFPKSSGGTAHPVGGRGRTCRPRGGERRQRKWEGIDPLGVIILPAQSL